MPEGRKLPTAHLELVRSLYPAWERARGQSSGVDVGQVRGRTATLFHVRSGRVTRLVVYADRHRALADLGLPSEGGSP